MEQKQSLQEIWDQVGQRPFVARPSLDALDHRDFSVHRVEDGKAFGHFQGRSTHPERYRNASRVYWELVSTLPQTPKTCTQELRWTSSQPQIQNIPRGGHFTGTTSFIDSKVFQPNIEEPTTMNVYDYAVIHRPDTNPANAVLVKRDSILAVSEEKAKFRIVLGLDKKYSADLDNVDIQIRPFK